MSYPTKNKHQKEQRMKEARWHIIERLNACQSAIKELSDEEIKEIAGGGPATAIAASKPAGPVTYAFRLLDTLTVGYAGYSIAKTGRIY
jgi:hypothetical protein